MHVRLVTCLSIVSACFCGCFQPQIMRRDASSATATYYGWVRQLGQQSIAGSGADTTDQGLAVAADSSGNVYVTGTTFGSLGETRANPGTSDVFLSKWNSSGTLQWVKQLGAVTGGAGANFSDRGVGVKANTLGNIIVAVQTSGDLGETNGGGNNPDVYVSQWDSSGNLSWSRQLGSVTMGGAAAQSETVVSLAVDSSNNIIVTGTTTGSFGEANGGGIDVYVAKWNSAGTLQWVRQLGNVTIGAAAGANEYVTAASTDSSGNVYISGYTAGSLAELNGGGGNTDAFIVKYNSAGVFQWVRQLGNATLGSAASGSDAAFGIGVDSAGSPIAAIYTTGSLAETNGGSSDVAIAKWNSAGTLQWVKQLGSTTMGSRASGTDDLGNNSLAIDSSDSIYIAGSTTGNLGDTNAGSRDLFVAQFNSQGVIQAVKQLGSTTYGSRASGDELSAGIGMSSSGRVLVCGSSFGSLAETNIGSQDVVAWSY